MIAADVRMLRSCRDSRVSSRQRLPLSGVLAELDHGPGKSGVSLKYLEEWRDDLHGVEKSRSNVA